MLERLAADSPERVRVFVHELAPSWLENLTTVEVVRGDLLRPASLGPLLADVTSVINLAGQVSAEIDDYQRVNLCGMVNLAQACLKYRVRRVIHASSALVYGNTLDATEEGPAGQHLGGVDGSTAGQHVHDGHVGEHEDGAE